MRKFRDRITRRNNHFLRKDSAAWLEHLHAQPQTSFDSYENWLWHSFD